MSDVITLTEGNQNNMTQDFFWFSMIVSCYTTDLTHLLRQEVKECLNLFLTINSSTHFQTVCIENVDFFLSCITINGKVIQNVWSLQTLNWTSNLS